MKQLLFLILFMTAVTGFAQSDEEAVKQVINTAYIGGIHNGGPIDDIRKGFHPSFIMFVKSENDVKSTTIEEWIANIEKGRQSGTKPANTAVAKFLTVSVNGTSAAAVLDLYRGEKKVFTDNLLLYKFAEGWRIVGKNFYRHP
ncbi:MAG TPA: nuclear transport factor 2 family protein [Cyclobacteriaceae bacterium]|nr:nuclear transport factor 2 family protein [Cyclobacteriaceae bacterium]